MGTAKASIKGHPIHPALVTIPIGLWTGTVLADGAYLLGKASIWLNLSLWTDATGVAFALLAAFFGLLDYSDIKAESLKRLATFHMLLNLVAVILFTVSAYLLGEAIGRGTTPATALCIQLIAFAGLMLGGYIGGELVFRHGMGVTNQ